jgi:hypothetical protein
MGTATGSGWTTRDRFPAGEKSLLYSTAFRLVLKSTQPPIQWILRALSPGVKRPGSETDHLPPSSVEIKNGGAVPTLPHTPSWRDS